MRPNPVCAGLCAGLLALLLAGCSRSVSPVASSAVHGAVSGAARAGAAHGGDFYPLMTGNWWHYQRSFRVWSGDELIEDYHATMTNEQVCSDSWMDRDYLVDRGIETADDGQVFRAWILARQDASGLFEADLSIIHAPPCDASAGMASVRAGAAGPDVEDAPDMVTMRLQSISDPARRTAMIDAWRDMQARIALVRQALAPAGGGPLRGELHRLSYPLHPGARWFIRDQPGLQLEAVVEAQETLHLRAGNSPAWRIRLVWHGGLYRPTDRIFVWYSRSGLMRVYYRIEDRSGLVSENDQVCDDFVLASDRALQ
jgi:hypothetical protein